MQLKNPLSTLVLSYSVLSTTVFAQTAALVSIFLAWNGEAASKWKRQVVASMLV